jgi:hypothetical protein
MNLKTFVILFLLGISCSCSLTYEKNFPVDEQNKEEKPEMEYGTFNK